MAGQDELMIRTLRAGLALSAALVVFAPLAAPLAAPARPAAAAKPVLPKRAFDLAPGQWPQAKSDLKADADVRFGALPNGMRYAVRKQSIPPGQAALRLWIDAGSLQENDDQQGLAHFLEHMAFNGSKQIKEGEMVKIMERLGLRFGPDTNAFTSFDQTVYMFDLPKTDAASLDTALMVMRETAGELSLAPAALDRERGVVLSEERQSDTPQFRVAKAQLGFMMPGQRTPTRFPIGQVEVLKTAPAERIQNFYRRYYRPERAVLVVVGDFDPAAMEAKIRARFSDWKGQGPAGGEVDLGSVQPRGPQAKVLVEPGAALNMRIIWVRPPDLSPDTAAERRKDLVRQLGFSVLNRRFSALARTADAPFIGAGAGAGNQQKSIEITSVAVNARPEQWSTALAAAEQEQRRIVQYGVRQDELDLEIEEFRTRVRAAVAGAATRRQSDLANEIVGSLSDDEVVTSPAQEQALFDQSVKGLTAAEVSAALKQSFQGQGPLVFIATPKPIDGGETAVLAQFAASQKVAVAAPAVQAKVAWPYESFGPAGKLAERREAADLGATFIRFENGVRLTVKPTKFRNDEVLVRVNLGDGLLSVPKDQGSMEILAAAFIEGGLKKISNEDMDRVLASKTYDADFDYGEDAFTLGGRTRTGDLATQLQVLAGFVSDAGWRPEAFQRYKSVRSTIHDQLEATDQGVLARELPALLHAGDRRWVVPSRDEIARASLDELRAQIAPHLASDPIEVVIVGDTTVDQAIAAVAATFGALPPRAAARPVPDSQKQIGFPAGVAQPVTFTHKGRADQAMAYIAWPTADFWSDPQRARELIMLGEVLRNRLTDELREAQGATYSPSASATQSFTWPGWGYMSASVEVPPAKVPEFFADVQKIAADLRTKVIDADELARAKKPRMESIQRNRVTNGYWVASLSNAQRDPRLLDVIRQQVAGSEKITAADVKRAAAFLKDDKAFKLVVKPQSAMGSGTADR
jgi:zinc protease